MNYYEGMPYLEFLPDSDGYSVDFVSPVVSVKLNAGPSRIRRDLIGTPFNVNVSYKFTPEQYRAFMGFYNAVTIYGSEQFVTDLIIEDCELLKYECTFVPDSIKLAEQRGLYFNVVCQIEAVPLETSVTTNEDIAILWEEYGPRYMQFPTDEDRLHIVVNIEYPQSIRNIQWIKGI